MGPRRMWWKESASTTSTPVCVASTPPCSGRAVTSPAGQRTRTASPAARLEACTTCFWPRCSRGSTRWATREWGARPRCARASPPATSSTHAWTTAWNRRSLWFLTMTSATLISSSSTRRYRTSSSSEGYTLRKYQNWGWEPEPPLPAMAASGMGLEWLDGTDQHVWETKQHGFSFRSWRCGDVHMFDAHLLASARCLTVSIYGCATHVLSDGPLIRLNLTSSLMLRHVIDLFLFLLLDPRVFRCPSESSEVVQTFSCLYLNCVPFVHKIFMLVNVTNKK